jgi:hydrogenase expression/formation protein HypC
MCLAAPSRIIELRDGVAVVECFGHVRETSLLLMDEDLAVGDYVLIQAGGFAFEKVEIDRALEALDVMREVMEQGGDARDWGLFSVA